MRTPTPYTLFALLALLWVLPTSAQDMYTVSRYSTHDGMPHNLNQSYVQDNQGFIWVGTRNGVARFDGRQFHTYNTSPQGGFRLKNNRIKHLWAGSTDKIWVQTFDDLIYMLDPKTERFVGPIDKPHTTQHTRVIVMEGGITYLMMDPTRLYRIDESDPHLLEPGHEPHLLKVGPDDTVNTVFQDPQGREWLIGSRGVGLIEGDTLRIISPITYDKIWEADGHVLMASRRGELVMLTDEAQPRIEPLAHCPEDFVEILPATEGKFIVQTPQAIYLYHLREGRIGEPECLWEGPTPADGEMLLGSDGTFWAFNQQGELVQRDPYTRELHVMPCPRTGRQIGEQSLRTIHEDRFGQIWVLTDEGLLCHYDEAHRRLQASTRHQGGEERQYVERVRYYFVDRQRNLWLSTNDGMDLLAFHPQKYEWMATSDGGDRNASRQNVRCVFEDGHFNVWVCTQDGRVEIYDREHQYVGNLTPQGHVEADRQRSFGARVYCMMQDNQGNLWMGIRGDGVYVLRPQGLRGYTIQRYRHDPADAYSLSSNQIFALCQDTHGRVWIGTFGGGLCLAQPREGGGWRFVHRGNDLAGYPREGFHRIRCMAEADDGTMMVCTTQGLLTFSTEADDITQATFHRNTDGRADGLNSPDVCHVMQDRTGRIYLSTIDAGINVVQPRTNLLSDSIPMESYTQHSGLMTDVVLATLEDLSGRIWVISPNAFSRWDVAQGNFAHIKPDFLRSQITLNEGLPAMDHDGNFIVGTTNGALLLLTDHMQPSQYVPPLAFESVRIHGTETYIKQRNADQSIDIEPHERTFSVGFVCLDYSDPSEIQYAYRLRANESPDAGAWIRLGHNRQVSFANIPPGRYTLEVRSTNGDGVWINNNSSLALHVIPTFRETGWAIALGILAGIVVVLLSVLIIVYVIGLRREVGFERRLTEMKLKFFTNISHELRTPLTLIAGPIDEVLQRENLTEGARQILGTAQRNTDRMLRLVNQILDFKKVQSGRMRVRIEPIDIVALSHKVYLNFTALSARRDMRYTYDADEPHHILYTDAEKVEKILYNLLSNAFKYTPDHKAITLRTRAEGPYYTLQVIDEGKGFDSKDAKRLFLRFETGTDADPHVSSGIGLALTKELVRILHGRLRTEGVKGQGSTFTIELPTDPSVYSSDENAQVAFEPRPSDTPEARPTDDAEPIDPTIDPPAEGLEGKPHLLIVDDNAELRGFIRYVLSDEYQISEANDGQEGLQKCQQLSPDLVLSDIMMPGMDGIAMLNALKTDPDTSHIPVMLLTAKTSVEDQIKGMEAGADDYITKPFNTALLRAKVSALVSRREQLRHYYLQGQGEVQVQADATNWEPGKPQITRMDNEFITRVIEGIEANIENPDLNMDVLSQNMNVSRSVFYRKIKAIVGLTPVDFVRSVRVKHVIKLMEDGMYSVTDLAYGCGFSSPQYLSRVFKEITGTTPTEYIKKLKGEK